MAATEVCYSVDREIADFFEQIAATRSACDAFAREHVGGHVVPVAVQGVCSCTVYAGSNAEFVVQFRRSAFQLNLQTMDLARAIYGDMGPRVTFEGQIGEDASNK